jgi:hypothetical protein
MCRILSTAKASREALVRIFSNVLIPDFSSDTAARYRGKDVLEFGINEAIIIRPTQSLMHAALAGQGSSPCDWVTAVASVGKGDQRDP